MLKYRIIAKEQPKSVITEQYRKLRTNIEFSKVDTPIKVVNFTSALASEGKTMTAINLATVYSQNKQKTLLIDMDLRRPKIHRAFKKENIGGLTGYLVNGNEVEHYIEKVDDCLDVMFSGEFVPFPAEMFSSNKIKDMMTDLREKYDRIIIDCPPISAVANSILVSNLCDGTIFVVGSRKTPVNVCRAHIDELKRNGANVLGGVITRVEKRDQYYGLDYYYYYNNYKEE